MFGKKYISTGPKFLWDYMHITPNPKTQEEIDKNRELRSQLLINGLTDLGKINPADTNAVKQFWATQK